MVKKWDDRHLSTVVERLVETPTMVLRNGRMQCAPAGKTITVGGENYHGGDEEPTLAVAKKMTAYVSCHCFFLQYFNLIIS
jgi:hypothetical protein